MKRLIGLVFLSSILLNACASAPRAERPAASAAVEASKDRTLIVFAASSLTEAFKEIGAAFEAANAGTKVTFNFAGAPTLRTQIEEGAPADVFVSANTEQMDLLVADGMIAQDAPHIFLTNELVVVLPPNNPAELNSLQDLARSGLKLVLAAEDVPVGNYARQALDKMNSAFGGEFKRKVLANVVSNEDTVKQVVTKVQLGEADAGIVYTSDAIAAPDVQTIQIPAGLNVIAAYPIAVLADAPNAAVATRFTDYMRSSEAQAVLRKWGFHPVD